MSKRKTRKATWLLTVASAYSVLPGCSDDASPDKPDSSMASRDTGVTHSAPARSDAATARDSGSEAGGSDTATAQDSGSEDGGGDGLDPGVDIFTTLIGVLVFPPRDEDPPALDAGSMDTPPAPDASEDAGTDAGGFITGLVALPPEPTQQALTMATLDRPPREAPSK